LYFIAEKYRKEFSIGSEIISKEIYADDLLRGADCIEDLKLKIDQVTGILSSARLELAKWNFSTLDDNIKEHRFKLNSKDITKTLGMSWRPQLDEFCFRFDLPKTNAMTKRNILSIIARLYDILGLLGPVVIRCKTFVQELWMTHLDWDKILPQQLIDRWQSIYPDLHNLNQIAIPRYVRFSPKHDCEIHEFADASQRAYGCCIYLRSIQNGSVESHLLIAKSKVAPLKVLSLPRLEQDPCEQKPLRVASGRSASN